MPATAPAPAPAPGPKFLVNTKIPRHAISLSNEMFMKLISATPRRIAAPITNKPRYFIFFWAFSSFSPLISDSTNIDEKIGVRTLISITSIITINTASIVFPLKTKTKTPVIADAEPMSAVFL